MRNCTHPGCDRPYRRSGYCSSHARQFRQWGKTFDLTSTGRAMHRCQEPECDEVATGFCEKHMPECAAVGCSDPRRSHLATYCEVHHKRNYFLHRNFNISLPEVEEMLDQQDNRCAICRRNGPATLHLDHCHETGRIRGLLCGNCNRGIGLLAHDPEVLRRAADYLA